MNKKTLNILTTIAFIISFMVIIFLVYYMQGGENNYKKGEVNISKYVDSMSRYNFDKRVKNNVEFIVYIGRNDCSDCNEFDPIFTKFLLENNLTDRLYYLDVKNLAKEKNRWEEFKQKYDISSTPTIAHYKDGKIYRKADWSPEKGIDFAEVKRIIRGKINEN